MNTSVRKEKRGRFVTFYAIIAIFFIAGFQGYWLYSVYKSQEDLILQESENYLKQYVLSYDGLSLAKTIQSTDSSLSAGITNQIMEAANANMNVEVKIIGADHRLVSDGIAREVIDSVFSQKVTKDADKKIYSELKSNLAKSYPDLKFGIKSSGNDIGNSFPNRQAVDPSDKNITIFSKINPFQKYTLVLYNVSNVIVRAMIWPMLLSLLYLMVCAGAVVLLINSMRKSRRLMEMKDNFTNNMTHELKTPLAALFAAAEALDKYNMIEDKTTAREYVQLMQADVKRLIGMTESILYNARLSDGKVYLALRKTALKKLLEEVILKFRLLAERQGARINITGVPDNLFIKADDEHLANVFSNLIDNSLKYSAELPVITIESFKAGNYIKILFSDNGIGISDKYYKEIFKPYFRVSEGDRHKVKGYGLGLSYAQEIMMLHNGNIKIIKSQEGKGSTFELTIPAADE